jgi:ATP-dependent Lhr-like helicase
LHGADGTLEIIRQLQGYEIPSAAWEFEVFPHRVAAYKPEFLDELCLSGEVTWGRLSPHPALEGDGRHVRPTRIAPISSCARTPVAGSTGRVRPERPFTQPARCRELERSGAASSWTWFAARTARERGRGRVVRLVAAGLVTATVREFALCLIRSAVAGRARPRPRPRHAAGDGRRSASLRQRVRSV